MEQSKDLNERLTKMRLDLDELGKQLATDIQEQLSEVRSDTAKSRQLSGILFCCHLRFHDDPLGSQLHRNSGAMVDRLKDIAQGEGDLTQRLAVNSNDEISELAKWFNSFREAPRIIAEVGDTTQDLTNNVEPATPAKHELKAKTSQQATMVAEAANDVSDNKLPLLVRRDGDLHQRDRPQRKRCRDGCNQRLMSPIRPTRPLKSWVPVG